MNTLLNGLKDATNFGYTENGAIKRNTTKSDLLDMFAMGGSMRKRSNEDIILMFKKAYEENPVYALKCLFYLRDVRGGQGQRRFFRVVINWLANHDTPAVRRNMKHIPLYGRWDDLYALIGTPLEKEIFSFMKNQLALDVECETPSLLAKWLPSENTSSLKSRELATKTRIAFGMTSKQYRKTLSLLRKRINIVERLMSENRWAEIEFDKIPSRAGLIYKNAFARHDIERIKQNPTIQSYADFAKDKTKKVNADVLNPVDIADRIFNGEVETETDRAIMDKYWANLKDYYNGREENGIAICDVSGSMWGQPLNAAVSMSAYIAERGKGPFKDHFITFSSNPSLVKFEGIDITDKFIRAAGANWGNSTNVEAAMNLILQTALKNNVPTEEMPEVLYIFSDLEFDACMTCEPATSERWDRGILSPWGKGTLVKDTNTFFERLAQEWKAYGYELPRVIFWNLDSRTQNIPALGGRFSYVSGFSMNMLETIFSGKDGYMLMMMKLDSDRYSVIH